MQPIQLICKSLSVCCNQFVSTNTLIHRHNTIDDFVHQTTLIKQCCVIGLIIGGGQNLIITFHSEMYSDRACLCACVCLCFTACLHYCTYPDVTWGNGWADLQSVHGFDCYGNIRAKCEMSARTLVLAVWLVVTCM